MRHASLLYDLYANARFDLETLQQGGRRAPGPQAQAAIEAFEALLGEFPPAQLEKEGAVPAEAIRRMGEAGLFGLTIPEEFGGLGLPFSEYLAVVERMAQLDIAASMLTLAHLSIGLQGIVLFGDDEQKQRLLTPAARGELVFAYALTEPAVGSDAQHIESSARLAEDGSHYVLNGQKTYITNANYAGAFMVFAQVEGHKPGHMVALVVERDTEGLTVGPDMPKMGLKASSTAFLRFEDLKVPAANRIGREGDGFRVAMTILNYGRLAVCAAGVGLMEQSLADMLQRAGSRKQFGVPIRSFDLIQEKLVEAKVNAFIGSAMLHLAARELEDEPTGNVAMETSHCKLFITSRTWQTLYDAQQVAGGSGYLSTSPYEKRLRDYRVATIFEGTTEIHSIYPSLFLIRGLAKNLPRGGWARVKTLLKGALARAEVPKGEGDREVRKALATARRCAAWVNRLTRFGMARYGKGVAEREFYLRAVTWLSAHAFGLWAGWAEIERRRGRGESVELEREALAGFAAEARGQLQALPRTLLGRRAGRVRRIAKLLGGGSPEGRSRSAGKANRQ